MKNNWRQITAAAQMIREARKVNDGLPKSDYESMAEMAEELDEIAFRAKPIRIAKRQEKISQGIRGVSPLYRIGLSGEMELVE